jgi:hypothetical protein
VWLCVIAISIWQWVSVWRSATCYRQRKRSPWAFVAKALVVLAFLQLVTTVVRDCVPQMNEAIQVAFLNDPDIPDYAIRVMRNGTEAEITGGIKYGLAVDFRKALDASPQVKVVHLNSVGGRIGEGEKLYDLIKERGLITYVSTSCQSACTDVFAAGAVRVLKHGAVLGFHRGTFAGKDETDSPELQGQRRIFTAAGYDPAFIDRALATPNNDVWTPTEAELLSAHVVTKISDGSDYAISGFPAGVSKTDLAQSLIDIAGAYAAMRDRFPDRFNELVEITYKAVNVGDTEANTFATLRGKLTDLVAALRPRASDDVLLGLWNLRGDEFAALQKQDPAQCYQYATAGTYDGKLPDGLDDRQLALEERLIRSAANAAFPVVKPDAATWTKLGDKLGAKGFKPADWQLDTAANVQGPQQAALKARYCALMIALSREVVTLPPNEMSVMIRALSVDK